MMRTAETPSRVPDSGSLSRTRERVRVRARALRQGQTDAEALSWSKLKGRQIRNLKFRRQHPIGQYFADFICLEIGLIIEPRNSSGPLVNISKAAWILTFSSSFIFTFQVTALCTRLHRARRSWLRCSSLATSVRYFVSPCQARRSRHTRAHPTAVSRLN